MGRNLKAFWAEPRGLAIRRRFGVALDQPLCPLTIAKALGITVVKLSEIVGIPRDVMLQLLSNDPYSWSAATFMLPRGKIVILLNPMQSLERTNATLMEEICHILLGHEPTRISTLSEFGIACRSFNKQQEEEAYWVGAAALVPYTSLRQAIMEQHRSAEDIANQYEVSPDLVKFRIKVNGLWKRYCSYAGEVVVGARAEANEDGNQTKASEE